MNLKTRFFTLVYAALFPHFLFSKRSFFKISIKVWFDSKKRSAVFFDLDGTLWVDQGPGGILNYKEHLISSFDILDSSKLRKQLRFGISNQTLFAHKSQLNFRTYFAYRRALREVMNHFHFDAVSLCNHHPEAQNPYLRRNCLYRKPNPLSILKLAEYFKVSKSESLLIGDRITDIVAGNEAGIGRNLLLQNDRAFEKNRMGMHSIPEKNFAFQFIDNLNQINKVFLPGNLSTLFLCAGKGTRLSPLTSMTPKPLLMLDRNTSILSRLINQISILFPDSQININISHLPEAFVNHPSLKLFLGELGFLWEEFPLGSGETVRNVFDIYGSSLLVINGDMLLSNSDIEIFKDVLNQDPNTSVMACHYREVTSARSRVGVRGRYITSFTEGRPVQTIDKQQVLVNSGIYFFARKDLTLYLENKQAHNPDLTQGLIPFLINQNLLSFHVWSDNRVAIDSHESLARAREKIGGLHFN